MLFYLPIALTALATTLYHIAQKSIVPGVHPMVSLVITYATSLMACLVVVPFAPGGVTFVRSLRDLNWATYVVGLSIVGVELAILLAYRAGWKISLASVVANVATALPLVLIGVVGSSARWTSGCVPRPSGGSAGGAARSSSWGVAPRAARRARACSTRRRDLDVPDGLPEIPTATRSVVNRSRFQDQVPRPISSAWSRRPSSENGLTRKCSDWGNSSVPCSPGSASG